MVASEQASLIEKQFKSADYQLENIIGAGGFGYVYRAKQLNTHQTVAIKFLTISSDFDETTKKRYIERFERETQLCSRLQHPNIVRLLDKGQCNELAYAVYEYVEGQTLKQFIIDNGSINPLVTAQIMAQVLDALVHAHEQGVIHRDIKPANIMLTKTGAKMHAKVLDFGIGTLALEARQLDHKTITLTQETLGTPAYSAPEQLRGEPPTPKTDIYVWGLVVIECLMGTPAISGSSVAAIFHKQLSPANVPLPPAIAGHPLATLLRRVLNKTANQRVNSAAEVYQEFSQLNFSTLVGDISNSAIHKVVSKDSAAIDIDETQLSENYVAQTGLTERKQISVLCVTLNIRACVDELIDIEVAEALYRDQISQTIDIAVRFGATHVTTLTGTILFYFGYPIASDNDGRLCARTALEISSQLNKRNALLKQNQGVETQISMGMNTGLVTIYADAMPEGNTANVAVELAKLADNNQILITANSKSLLDAYLEFQPEQSQRVGLYNQTQQLYTLIAERQVEAFGFLRGNKNRHPFIGRESELNNLNELTVSKEVESTNCSTTNCAHVFGEAGIGKSRLIFEFRELASEFNHYVAQCLPEHQNNALYPILNVVKYKYALDGVAKEHATTLLVNHLADYEAVNLKDTLPILCSWLALPLPQDIKPVVHSPDVQKQLLFDGLMALLIKPIDYLTKQSNLFLFEDMHWADPTSIEFIEQFCTSDYFTKSHHVFISTSREPLPDVLQGPFEIMALSKLTNEDTSDFIQMLFDDQPLSLELMDTIVTRTDGIPLFIEELVDMLKQKELVHFVNGKMDFVNKDAIAEVPSSLRDSLQQKLDGLVYAKETAQLAATIGREFDYNLLVAASERREEQVQIDLDELINDELVYLQRKVSGDSYIFKHALVRDAAYESLPLDKAKYCHKTIASQILYFEGSQKVSSLPIVALHYYHAHCFEDAFKTWKLAGEKFTEHNNSLSAINYFKDSLKALNLVQTDLDSIEEEIEIRASLGVCYCSVYGYASEEVTENQRHINRLTSSQEDLDGSFMGQWIEGVTKLVQADYYAAKPIVHELAKFAVDKSDFDLILPAYVLKMGYYWHRGEFQKAKELGQYALSHYQFETHSRLASKYTYDPGIAIMCEYFSVLFALGENSQAQYYRTKAITLSHKCTDKSNLAHTLVRCGQAATIVREYKKALDWANEAIELSQTNELTLWRVMSSIIQGWALSNIGDDVIDAKEFEIAFQALKDTGTKAHTSWYLTLLTEIYFNNGQLDKALNSIDEAIEFAEQTEDALYLVPSYLLKIQILLNTSDTYEEHIIQLVLKMMNLLEQQASRGFMPRIRLLLSNENNELLKYIEI